MEYGCPSVSYRVDVAHSFIPVLFALQRLLGKRRELFQSLIDQISYEDFSDSCVTSAGAVSF